jgi:hypothetical protein
MSHAAAIELGLHHKARPDAPHELDNAGDHNLVIYDQMLAVRERTDP